MPAVHQHKIPLCPLVGRQHTSPAATTSTAAMAQEGTSATGGAGDRHCQPHTGAIGMWPRLLEPHHPSVAHP